MKNQIQQAIIEKFGTQRKFCEKHGYDEKDILKKIKTRDKAINKMNKFFEPMDLELTLAKIKKDE